MESNPAYLPDNYNSSLHPHNAFSRQSQAGCSHTIFHQQSQAASHRIRHKCHSTTNKRNRRKKGPKRMRSGLLISIFLPITAYRLLNCGALRAFLRPYFLRSFIRGSRVRYPAFFNVGLRSKSYLFNALAIP